VGSIQVLQRTGSKSGERDPERVAPILYAVDDDVATVDLLCEVAGERGWVAYPFTRIESLYVALRRRRPTLIVLDDELPDGRGGDVARELRRDPATAGIPLLVCTAAHPMRQAEIGGWAPVVAKPFDLEQVERFLDAATRRHDGSESLDEAG
jgi:DNA-binding response OmpR family regulator